MSSCRHSSFHRILPRFYRASPRSQGSEQRLGLLCPVRMVRPGIDLQLGRQPTTQTILGEHALDRLADHPGGLLVQHLLRAGAADSSWIPRVTDVLLVAQLGASETNALGIHDDDEV